MTIEFYGFGQNPSNSYFKWQQDYFAEKIGVNVAIISADSERLQPMLSAGNLPDMGCYAVNGSLSQAIQGGHLLDLTPYEKEISNFTEKWPEAAQYSKDYMSNGTGKLYGLPGALGRPNSFALNTGTYATQVRWDIYEKAGKPEVTDMYSFLDAAVKMKEVYPTTEDGLETYMIGLFPDGGAGGLFINPAYKWLEVSGVCGINDVATYDLVNNKLEYIFDKNSAFYQGLKWIATANRMGLVDPDSMTQTYEITQGKINDSGQYYTCLRGNYCDKFNTAENMNGENPKGFMPLIWEGQHPVVEAKLTKLGQIRNPYAISATTKKLDACLKFANFLYDEDAMMVMFGGPQGELWDIVDGKYVLTDAAEEFRKTGKHTFGTGEEGSDWWGYWGLQAAHSHSKYPDFTFRITDSIPWTEARIADNKIYDMYEEHYGKRRPIEIYEEYDAICYRPEWQKLIETMPDGLSDTLSGAVAVLVPLEWQMLLNTKDDAEFDRMFEEIAAQAENLGVKAVYDWTAEQVEKARKAYQKYQ